MTLSNISSLSFSPAPKTLHTSTPWTRVPTSWLVLNWAHHAYSLCVRSDRVCPDSEAPTQICRLGINSPSFPKSNNWIEHPPKDQLTKKWYKVLERAKDCYSNPHSYTRWLVRRGICLWETLAQSSRDCRVLGQEEARGLMRKKRNSEDSKLRSMSPYKENLKYLYIKETRKGRWYREKIFTTTLNELVLCFILAKPKCISI